MCNDQLKWPVTELRGNKPLGQTRIYWEVLIVWGIQLFPTQYSDDYGKVEAKFSETSNFCVLYCGKVWDHIILKDSEVFAKGRVVGGEMARLGGGEWGGRVRMCCIQTVWFLTGVKENTENEAEASGCSAQR